MSWTKRMSRERTLDFIKEVSSTCSLLGGPTSSLLNSKLQQGCYLDVINHKLDYDTLSLSDALYSRQIKALVEKQDFLDLGIDTEHVAFDKFKEMEEKCLLTNARLGYARSPNGDVASVFHRAQRKIQAVLGRLPNWNELDFSFGPGATTSVKMAESCFRSKLNASLVCSNDFLPVVGEFLAEFPSWVEHHSRAHVEGRLAPVSCVINLDNMTIEEHQSDVWDVVDVSTSPGKLTFVPKSSKTDRPIVVEPTLNGIAQKGYGSYMKDRLLRHGVNLRDQTVNQKLARQGSLKNDLATIDLSSASDCVSISLVWDLLPFDWAERLSQMRTGVVSYRGVDFVLEKFSSMGNGFTFELESLIFFGLMVGVCQHLGLDEKLISVYGDDIIIPVDAYVLAKEVLEYAGFSFNEEKSYCFGPFRESCGTDWLRGFDVRPWYLREKISVRLLFAFHNWCIRNCENGLAAVALKWIPGPYRIFGPDGYGDGHLVGSHTLRLSRKLRRAGWCGGFFDTFVLRKKFFKKLLPGDWLVPQYSVYTRASERGPVDPDLVRGSAGYAKMSIYTLATSVFRRYF